MKINSINFTGIKNIGYAQISVYEDGIQINRNIMNMELTDDDENKDLSKFKQFTKKYPALKNEINDRFVNIEFVSVDNNRADITFIPRLNGLSIPSSEQTKPIFNFMKGLVDRVSKFKAKDFKTDSWYHYTQQASKGLIYDENLSDYITGIAGELDILKDSGMYESFEDYFEREGDLKEKDAEKLVTTTQAVAEVLHNPQYVHNGSIYLGALLKSYSDLANDKYFS